MEDKSLRTETVRLQFGECRESQSECDSALSVKIDGNDTELYVETDDEDMEDCETGFDDGSAQVRNIRDPGQPTANKHQEHMTTHRPYRSWCKFCVMGRGVCSPHRRSDAQDDLEGVRERGRKSEERVTLVLVIRDRRHKMTWAMLVPAKFIDQLGPNRVTLRCDNEPAIEALSREIAQARQEGSRTASGRKSV